MLKCHDRHSMKVNMLASCMGAPCAESLFLILQDVATLESQVSDLHRRLKVDQAGGSVRTCIASMVGHFFGAGLHQA